MRRFTTASITMLAGLIAAPACGAFIGIDNDDRILDPNVGVDASPTTDGDTTPTVDGNTSTEDAGAKCELIPCGFFAGLSGGCNAQGQCERRCAGSGCRDDNRCPDGHDCVIKCEGSACQDLTCEGGRSCTIDCIGGDCNGVRCESPTCTFLCGMGAKSCENVSCRGANTTCRQACSNPSGPIECKAPVDCCVRPSEDDDDDGSPQRVCPPSSTCKD